MKIPNLIPQSCIPDAAHLIAFINKFIPSKSKCKGVYTIFNHLPINSMALVKTSASELAPVKTLINSPKDSKIFLKGFKIYSNTSFKASVF